MGNWEASRLYIDHYAVSKSGTISLWAIPIVAHRHHASSDSIVFGQLQK